MTVYNAPTVLGAAESIQSLLDTFVVGDVAVADGYSALGDGGGGGFYFEGSVPASAAIIDAIASSFSVTEAKNAAPILITTSSLHDFVDGQSVLISGVGGNTAANGTWIIAKESPTDFSLVNSAGNGDYTSGGTASSVTITTSDAHARNRGQRIAVAGCRWSGGTGINGQWNFLGVVTSTTLSIPVATTGTYRGGGVIGDNGFVVPSTAVVGRWLRRDTAPNNPLWWGAVPDADLVFGTGTDNFEAFTAAIAAMPVTADHSASGTLFIPQGYYRVSRTIKFAKKIIIEGEGAAFGTATSVLMFDAGVTALQLLSANETSDQTGADGSIIRNLGLSQPIAYSALYWNRIKGPGNPAGIVSVTTYCLPSQEAGAYKNVVFHCVNGPHAPFPVIGDTEPSFGKEWLPDTTFAPGDFVYITDVEFPVRPAQPLLYRCTTGGTSGFGGPTWVTGPNGSTVTDGSVVWMLDLTDTTISDGGAQWQAVNPAHGIDARCRVKIQDISIMNINGCGIYIRAAGGASSNANGWYASRFQVSTTAGHGLYLHGPDSNAGYSETGDFLETHGYGILDDSFLGNVHIGHQVAFSGRGSYASRSANSYTLFIGCYQEGGQPKAFIGSPAAYIQGLGAQGFTDDSQTYIVSGPRASSPLTITSYGTGNTWGCSKLTTLLKANESWQISDRCIPTVRNGYHFRCIKAGNSGDTEPVWPTTIGEEVTDGTVTWVCNGLDFMQISLGRKEDNDTIIEWQRSDQGAGITYSLMNDVPSPGWYGFTHERIPQNASIAIAGSSAPEGLRSFWINAPRLFMSSGGNRREWHFGPTAPSTDAQNVGDIAWNTDGNRGVGDNIGWTITTRQAKNDVWSPFGRIYSDTQELVKAPRITWSGGRDLDGFSNPFFDSKRDGKITADTDQAIAHTYVPSDGDLCRIVVQVLAKRTDVIGDCAYFVLRGVWLRQGSSLTEVSAAEIVKASATAGASAWLASLGTSGSAIQTLVRGEGGKIIHWSVIHEAVEAV
jgi:Pectate lyase superfamily protein